MTTRFGQVQRFRPGAARYGRIADVYLRLFGTTSLFALNCYWLLKRTIRGLESEPRAVLDAGCGKGDFTFAVAGLLPEADVLGVDVSNVKAAEFDRYKDNIEVCRQLNAEHIGLTNARFEERDLLTFDEQAVYDFIFCIHVLEHIPENSLAIRNMARALKPGGSLYIQMPSRTDLTIDWLRPHLGQRLHWEKVEHVACLTRDELVDRVESAGLEVERAEAELGYFLSLAWQAREALVTNERAILGALALPWLKGAVWLHRRLADFAPGPYRRWSLRRTGAEADTEGVLELLARKPCTSTPSSEAHG